MRINPTYRRMSAGAAAKRRLADGSARSRFREARQPRVLPAFVELIKRRPVRRRASSGGRGALAALASAFMVLLLPALAHAGQVGVTVHIQGSGLTEVVEGSLEDGGSRICDRLSNKDERVTMSCARIRNEEVFEAWVWLRPHASGVPNGHWRFAGWTGCDETRQRDGYLECGVHSGAFNGVERSPKAHFADDFPPTVSPVAESFSSTLERTVSYFFSTNEGQLQCRFDNQVSFSSCSSGVTKTYDSEGTKTIEVRAVDPSGQVGSVSSRTVVVVDTALTDGPSENEKLNSRSASFGFSSHAGNAFMCSLDHAPYTDCGGSSKTYEGLSDGTHNLRVYAKNGGWHDRIPVSRNWRVDATAPETTITSGPSGMVASRNASFGLAASEGGSTFECRIDGGEWSACGSNPTYFGLDQGSHTFEVAATDSVGNRDETPAKRTWEVDTVAPRVTGVSPSPGARGVAPTANVLATFSERMQPSTVTTTTVKLVRRGATTPVSATVTYDPSRRRAKLDPSSALRRGATYTAQVTRGAKDLAGNPMESRRAWSFTVKR